MSAPEAARATRIASIVAALVAVAVYVAVAPLSCDEDGWCHGLLAFDYARESTKHVQAVGAAALVGGVTFLLVWLAAAPERSTPRGLRAFVSVLLVAFGAVTVLSHSVLFVAGPVGAAAFLWLLWGRGAARRGRTG